MAARALRAWVPLAVLATVMAAILYGVAQQQLRDGADDPQLQLAEESVARLAAGAPASAVAAPEPVDLAVSAAPWVAVYDRDRRPLAASARLDGEILPFPVTVLDNARPGHPDRITWMPRPGVRQATVVVAWTGGWVVSGRSLLRVEEREGRVAQLVAAGWLASLVLTAAATLAVAHPAFER